jgi:hypothetical protein
MMSINYERLNETLWYICLCENIICVKKAAYQLWRSLVRVFTTPQSYLVFRNEEAIRGVMGMSHVESLSLFYTEPTWKTLNRSTGYRFWPLSHSGVYHCEFDTCPEGSTTHTAREVRRWTSDRMTSFSIYIVFHNFFICCLFSWLGCVYLFTCNGLIRVVPCFRSFQKKKMGVYNGNFLCRSFGDYCVMKDLVETWSLSCIRRVPLARRKRLGCCYNQSFPRDNNTRRMGGHKPYPNGFNPLKQKGHLPTSRK